MASTTQWNSLQLTPGAVALLDSCMRTLIVSSGWHTRASIIPAPPPANQAKVNSCTSQKGGVYSTDQVDRGRCALLVGSFGGHCFNMWVYMQSNCTFAKIEDRRFHRNSSIDRLGNQVTKIFRLSQGRAEIAEKRKYTIPENKQKQPAIGKEGIYLEGLRKIKRSIAKTFNLFFKKKEDRSSTGI